MNKMLVIKKEVDLKEIGFSKPDNDLIWKDEYGCHVHDITRELYQSIIRNPEKSLERIYQLISMGVVENIETDGETNE